MRAASSTPKDPPGFLSALVFLRGGPIGSADVGSMVALDSSRSTTIAYVGFAAKETT